MELFEMLAIKLVIGIIMTFCVIVPIYLIQECTIIPESEKVNPFKKVFKKMVKSELLYNILSRLAFIPLALILGHIVVFLGENVVDSFEKASIITANCVFVPYAIKLTYNISKALDKDGVKE